MLFLAIKIVIEVALLGPDRPHRSGLPVNRSPSPGSPDQIGVRSITMPMPEAIERMLPLLVSRPADPDIVQTPPASPPLKKFRTSVWPGLTSPHDAKPEKLTRICSNRTYVRRWVEQWRRREGGDVAVKLVHAERSQEVRFGDRSTAESYASQHGGGLANWHVIPVPPRRPAINSSRRQGR